jgi:hypothetical protein
MDAELTGISRRFAACPKWVNLPGMQCIDGDGTTLRLVARDTDGLWLCGAMGNESVEDAPWYSDEFFIPDLDDETTRAAVLPVVRRAWDDPHAFVRFFDRTPLEGHWFWECGVGSRRQCGFVADVKHGELLALLAALESAK